MFQVPLVQRYLVSKVMPLLSVLAVMLCVTMVLVVWSVMGGFLNMLVQSGRTMTGDVIVAWPNVGFPHSDDLVARLERHPDVAAATPVVETYGLLGLPNNRTEMVFVRGVDGPGYARVTQYDDILWWRPIDEPLEKDVKRADPRLNSAIREDLAQILEQGRSLTRLDEAGVAQPAAVLGIEVSTFNRRERAGYYSPRVFRQRQPDGSVRDVDEFMPRTGEVVLSVLPMDRSGRLLEQASRKLPVANEFTSGIFEADSKVVLVPIAMLQDMLKLRGGKRVVIDATAPQTPQDSPPSDDDGFAGAGPGAGERLVDEPPRVTHVLVRGKGDLSRLGAADGLRGAVAQVYADFVRAHPGELPDPADILILTWEDQNRTMINAVRKETGLVLFLFTLISLTAVFLIMAIFWSMVAEKTKDIGVLRAVGASKAGVAWLWLLYGLCIGVVGAALGAGLAMLIVQNINTIHDWLGTLGIVIWSPDVYYFTRIPTAMDAQKLTIVVVGGLLSSVLGALIPAVRAARMDPVRALRFE